jgi:hypothetical protein
MTRRSSSRFVVNSVLDFRSRRIDHGVLRKRPAVRVESAEKSRNRLAACTAVAIGNCHRNALSLDLAPSICCHPRRIDGSHRSPCLPSQTFLSHVASVSGHRLHGVRADCTGPQHVLDQSSAPKPLNIPRCVFVSAFPNFSFFLAVGEGAIVPLAPLCGDRSATDGVTTDGVTA